MAGGRHLAVGAIGWNGVADVIAQHPAGEAKANFGAWHRADMIGMTPEAGGGRLLQRAQGHFVWQGTPIDLHRP